MNEVSEAWYTIAHWRGVGPKTLHALREALGTDNNEAMLEVAAGNLTSVSTLKHSDLNRLSEALLEPVTEIEPSFAELSDAGVEAVYIGHEYYPAKLVQRLGRDAPPILYCSGYLSLLNADSVAIVGARDASPDALVYADQLAANFASHGINVVSGFARGIDTAAHQGALSAGGTTTFVLSSGICDSSVRRGLSELGESRDAVALSQFEPREPWRARNAMVRNRTVCALAGAVVVVQSGVERDTSGKMSGSFDAARGALKMRVPLFVVTSDAFESTPSGNQRLIELGAIAIDPRSDGAAFVIDAVAGSPSAGGFEPAQLRLLA